MSSGAQGADLADREQPLGVRARLRQHAADGRQPGAGHDDRQALLVDAVRRADQGAELLRRHLVQLVDEQGRAEALVARPLAEGHEELREVGLEVAAVGDTDLRLELQPEPAGDEARLHGPGEARRDAPDPLGALLVPPALVDGPHHRRQRLGELRPQVTARPRLEQLDRPAGLLGLLPERQQQHGLADPAQPRQHDRLEGVAGRRPPDDDVPGGDDVAPSGEQRRGRTGARGVGVEDRVHGATVARSMRVSAVL